MLDRIRTPLVAILVVVFLSGATGQAFSQDDYTDWVTDFTTSQIRALRNTIRDFGTEYSAQVDSQVIFIVDNSNIPYACYAMRDVTTHEIHFSTQLALIILYTSDMITIIKDRTVSFGDCIEQYFRHTNYQYGQLRTGLMDGTTLPDFPNSLEYAKDSRRFCHDLNTYDSIPLEWEQDRNDILAGTLAYIYLHELGHIALQHDALNAERLGKEEDAPALFTETTRRTREQELAADQWAIDRMFELRLDGIMLAGPFWTAVLMSSDGLDLWTDPLGTPEDGIKRLNAAMDRFRENAIARDGRVSPEKETSYENTLYIMRFIEQSFLPAP